MPRHTYNGVTGVIGGKLYVVVGFCSDCTHCIDRRLYRYDPATNTWNTSLAWSPHPHVLGAGGVIKGKFYVAGEATDVNGFPTTNLDVYDPVTNTWKTLAPLPFELTDAAGAVLQDQLYLIGSGHSGRSVLAYNPVTNTWKEKNALPTGRLNLAAASFVTPFGNPKILAVGGRGSPGLHRQRALYAVGHRALGQVTKITPPMAPPLQFWDRCPRPSGGFCAESIMAVSRDHRRIVALVTLGSCKGRPSTETASRPSDTAGMSMARTDSAAAPAAAPGALSDANIVALLDEANMADSAAGAYAVTKATNPEVKAFAKLMMGEHHALRAAGAAARQAAQHHARSPGGRSPQARGAERR